MSYESSSTTNSSPRLRFPGLPKKCSCGKSVIQKISKSERNPYRRYYRCLYAAEKKLVDDGHLFKWVDEAMVEEIEQLDYQVGVLEDEVGLLKIERRRQRKEIVITMLVVVFICFMLVVLMKLYN
ncbi:unnamed protein product [Cochlearia groenlandica]